MGVIERGTPSVLAYDVTGDGPPLVLLHGLSASRRWWDRNIPALAARFRTYAVDLPGFGESRRVRWSRLDDAVDLLAAWMDDAEITRAHVIGHSMGGAVAARLAAHFPERVDRLVLVNAAIRLPGTRAAARAADIVHSLSRTPAGFAPLLARDLLRCHPRSFVAAGADVVLADWRPHLARIAAPTLLVWGEHDVLTPVAFGSRLVSTVPGSRLVLMPGAGHSPMWEQPERFNVEVLKFLTESPHRLKESGPCVAASNKTEGDASSSSLQ